MKVKDIERNGHNFLDGIGKMSRELALEVAEKLQLEDIQPCGDIRSDTLGVKVSLGGGPERKVTIPDFR